METTTNTATVTYTKLRSGYWGVRGYNLKPGDVVTVTKRSGEQKQETVNKVFWTGPDGLSVASVRKSAPEQSERRTRRYYSNGRRDNYAANSEVRAAAGEAALNDTGRYENGYRTFDNGTVREDFGSDR